MPVLRMSPGRPAWSLCLLLCLVAPSWARTWFVAPGVLGDGSSWVSALPDVRAALGIAVNGDEVWVARGTYRGGAAVPSGVRLYGGFAGTETSPDQRDPLANPTILEGGSPILSLYDAEPGTIVSGFHIRRSTGSEADPPSGGPGIFIAGGTPRIQGNVISGCRAAYTFVCDDAGCRFEPLGQGGGLYVRFASPTITGNRIEDNQSTGPGGGIRCEDSALQITGNTIMGNRALEVPGRAEGNGGGIACERADATIADNTISWNMADYGSGGGIYALGGWLTVRGNTFVGNEASRHGGGIATQQPDSQSLTGNTFRLNRSAGDGGGFWTSGTARLAASHFQGNVADGFGGGVWAGAPVTVSSSTFRANAAREGGGLHASGATVSGSLFDRNIASVSGGGAAQPALLAGNTFSGNVAWRGGAASLADGSVFANNIVAGNTGGLLGPEEAAVTPVIRHNLFFSNEGRHVIGLPEPSPDNGNVFADPRLAAPADGDLHIQPGSPAIDAGDPAYLPVDPVDIDGQAVPIGVGVDIGADESDGTLHTPSPRVVRVRPDGNDASDGSDWPSARQTLRAAIEALGEGGGEVWMAAGVYIGQASVPGGVAVYGGFNGTETGREQRLPGQNLTVLDADRAGVPVTIPDGAVDVRLDGLTIRNGLADGAWGRYGAGVRCGVAQVEMFRCDITGNEMRPGVHGIGGGLGITGGVVLVRGGALAYNRASYGAGAGATAGFLAVMETAVHDNVAAIDAAGLYGVNLAHGCLVTGNAAGEGAGGLRTAGVLSGNIIRNNTGVIGGGLIAEEGAILEANRITDNQATLDGGGVYTGAADLRSNLVARNTASRDGGGVWAFGGVRLVNVTLAHNTAARGGAAFIQLTAQASTIANSIVAGNSSGLFAAPASGYYDAPVPEWTCFYQNGGADYNVPLDPEGTAFRVDPLFADATNGDYRLRPASSCVDAGNAAFVRPGDVDAGGLPRQAGAHVDAGAYESHVGTYGAADVARILRIAAGILPGVPDDVVRLDLEQGASGGRIDLADALRIARKAAGLEPNP